MNNLASECAETQICTICKTGKHCVEIDENDVVCPYIISYKNNACAFFEPLEAEKKLIVYDIGRIEKTDKPVYDLFKRCFDFFVSLIAIILCAIPMLIIGIIIRLDSPGAAVFKQDRLGKEGKHFIMYKFRTMVVDAEKNGPQWAERDDDRCTRFGRFLRKTRLDELVQLFNILKGDMSFVGPRPERECFYNKFEQYIPGFSQRLYVIPGLTGVAQINGGYDLEPQEKVIWDLKYIKSRSFLLDLKVIFKTVCVVFTHNGAR